MKARTRTGRQRDRHSSGGRTAVLAFPLVVALSTLWTAPSSADAGTPASRGPKGPERSCSHGGWREHDDDQRPLPGQGLGYRSNSAAGVQPTANSRGEAGNDCRDPERSAAASGADERGGSDPPETHHARAGGERRTPGSPTTGDPSASPPDPGAGARGGTSSGGPSGTSPTLGHGGSGTGANGSAVKPGADTDTDGANTGESSSGPSDSTGKAFSGGRRGGGNTSGPHGFTGGGTGGTHRAPGGGTGHGSRSGGEPGGSVTPAVPPGDPYALGSGVGGPRIAWASLRSPAAALLPSPGVLTLPSTEERAWAALGTATGAAAGPFGPIPRTGGEMNASTILALFLLVAGGALRRMGRMVRV